MDIKEDILVENVCLVANMDENVLIEVQQSFNLDVLVKEEPIELTGVSIQIQDVSAAPIKQEIEIKPITLLDSTNGVFIQEDQYLKINIKSEKTAADFSKKKIKCKFDLKYHSANEHPFKCNICFAKFSRIQSLKRHLNVHLNKYDFECNICNRKFKRKENLKDHLVTHSNRYDFKCNICNLKLRYRSCLRKHLITHLSTRDFECHTCQATFKRKDALSRHLKKKYKCNVCDCNFACRSGLKYHKVSHKKYEGSFNCVICLAKLKSKQSFKCHLDRHLYIYDFECSICDKKFKREEKWKKHLELHSTVGTLECHICRAPFTKDYNLKIHVKRHSIKPKKKKGAYKGIGYCIARLFKKISEIKC